MIGEWLQKQNRDNKSMGLLLIKGYFILTLVCFILLLLPFFRNAPISLIDHLFFSVSIVSTTGLAPTSFAQSYNLGGQIISLIFIQLGGIGYMALSSFVILKSFKRLPKISAGLLRLEFNLPERYPLLAFVYSVIIFTIIIEGLGAVALFYGFRSAGIEQPLWSAIFHSVSAFCTAGFSLYDDSLTSFYNIGLIRYTILTLSLLGSIGFIVLLDLFLKTFRYRKTITLTTKIILFSSTAFWLIAAIVIYLSDQTLNSQGLYGFGQSLFQSISAHTTVGFNSYDIGSINAAGIFVFILLMIIGASPAGTGGGIKTTSITAIIAVLVSILKRRKYVTFIGKEIPSSNVYLAVASGLFYTIILCGGTWVMLMIEGSTFRFENLLFEVASALSTVGLSTGITADLSDEGKMVISILMFIGRLGVLTIGYALISRTPLIRKKHKIEDIAI